MITKIRENRFFLTLFVTVLIIHQFIFQQFFPHSNNLLGHDYEQFIPNLIYGKIWFFNNFLSVPWFTPSFCCGIPFYADPQSMYYSIPQIVFLIFDPILSVKIIFLLLSTLSYIGMFLLANKNLRFDNYTSLLCASLFLFNGFFVYRAISGHVAYLTYIFIPLYCFFLIQSYENQSKNKSSFVYLILSSIIFANFFYSGSGPIILIILISILSVLSFYSLFIQSLKIFAEFVLSAFLGILISLSKITAVLFFLSNFPRNYPATEFHSFFSFVKTFFFSFFIKPNQEYFNDNLTSMFPFGLHEIEFGVSIVPLILIFFIFFLNKKNFKLNYQSVYLFLLLITIFLIPVLLNINFLNQFQLIQKIPILNSTWVQPRWMTIYILPIIIISGLIVQNLNFNITHKKYITIFFISILLVQNFMRDNSWHFNEARHYNVEKANNFSMHISKNKKFEVFGPAILMNQYNTPQIVNNKNDMFFYDGFSPLACYQPIFGYGLEKLNASKIIFNSKKVFSDNSYLLYSNKFDIKNDDFMFFNPSCFLFPEENNCSPGDLFKISEKEKLIKFTTFNKFDFKKNRLQIISNYISILTFIGCFLYLIYSFVIFIYNLRKNTN